MRGVAVCVRGLLEMHDSDALEFADDDNDDAPGDGELDLLWVDFGDGDALDEFFDKAGEKTAAAVVVQR